MEARKILGSAVLVAWALILSAGTAAGQYKSKIDVLKGEKWWGVFVTGEQMMPLEKPFPQTDLSTWVKSQATPFLVSSRGRYIWSREPFKIEFTGSGFLIDSPVEQVEAVTGGKTLREAYLVCCHRNFPPKEGNGVPAEGFFTAPLYDMTGEIPFGATAGQIRDFAESLLASGYPSGTLVVPSGWQQTIGSFTPSWNEYGDFAALARELHERGFRVLLTVTPFVSGDGPIFRAYRNSGAFVRMSDGRAAIAEWAGGYSAFYDITDPQVFDMLRDRLTALQDSCGVDGFVFDCEAALPYARFSREGTAEYLKKWSELGLGFGYSLYTISRTRGMAPYVSDLQMDARLDWAFLPQAVSNLISANLLGFPYSTVRADPAQPADSASVDQKLLLRYMQLASLLPVPAIGMAPWRITDPQIARQCRDALEIRGKLGGYYAALAAESSRTAEPLVRHMEYEFPRNGFTDCNDQFMIGSKYLVAPLLGESDTRTVRFPRGVWIGPQGERFKGPLVTTVTSRDGELLIFESAK